MALFALVFMILFSSLVPKNVSASEFHQLEFTEHSSDEKVAKSLFERVGPEARIPSDYIWKVDGGKALLNPLVLAYRYEGRRINRNWTCFKMKGVDERLSQWSWAEGLFGVSFPVPPNYFCEGQVGFEPNGLGYSLTVNTAAWESLLEVLEAQVRRFSNESEPEFKLYEDNMLLEYRVSRMPELSCRKLEAIHSKGVRYEVPNLKLFKHNLRPSMNPYEYKVLQRQHVIRCRIQIEVASAP